MGVDMLGALKTMPQQDLRRYLFDLEADVRLTRAVIKERAKLDRERVTYEAWLREQHGGEAVAAAGREGV